MTENLPHNLDAEQALVGSLLIDRDAMAQVHDWLPYEALHDGRCRLIYRAMRHLWAGRIPCDTVTLADMLNQHGKLDAIGGPAYLAELQALVPTSVHVVFYAETVLRYARQRAVMQTAAELTKQAYDADVDTEDAVRQLREAVAPFALKPLAAVEFPDLMAEVRETMLARWDGTLNETIVPTGIRDLDRLMNGGVRGGELFVLAARPSMGKTAMALRMLSAQPGVYISLEMPRLAIAQRLIVGQANVPYSVVASPIGDVAQRDAALFASEYLERTSPIVAVRDDLRTTGAIEAFLERAMAEQGAQSVVIDHIGLLADAHPKSSEYERVSRISWALKEMALRSGAAVIALSQLNRQVESRAECIPFMSDLRESGRVEENADAVALLWRRAYYTAKGMVTPDIEKDRIGDLERVVVNLAKNRNGEPGSVELGWHGMSMRFHEIARAAA